MSGSSSCSTEHLFHLTYIFKHLYVNYLFTCHRTLITQRSMSLLHNVSGTLFKEGVFLRNVSSFVCLSDHFPGSGILNYRSDRDWSFECVVFGCCVTLCMRIDVNGTMSTPITAPRLQNVFNIKG